MATKKKKKKKEKFKIKDIITSTKFLTTIFIILLIVVIALIVLCYRKNEENKYNGFANISIPIAKKDSTFEFSINAYTLATSDEYIFKVTNVKDKKINKEEISYKVNIENKTNSIISVTVNDMNDDLMKSQKSTILSDTLAKNEEDVVYYHVKIESYGELGKKDLINIRIDS